MVYVPHDGHDWRPQYPPDLVGMGRRADECCLWPYCDGRRGRCCCRFLRCIANLFGDFCRHIVADDFIDAGKDTNGNQVANDLVDRDVEQFRQVFDDDLRRNRYRAARLDGNRCAAGADCTVAVAPAMWATTAVAPAAATAIPARTPAATMTAGSARTPATMTAGSA